MLQVKELTKTYQSGSRLLTVLDDITFSIDVGDLCAIVGPSGSGKTTLLGLCAGLDSPSSGTVILAGNDLGECSEGQRAEIRRTTVGFVFQTFKLIPTLTALQNVMVPLELSGQGNARKYAMELLYEVGLKDREHHYPVQMSGGEQQRVGLARAFINRPAILFADEPTGNLDTATGNRIEELLLDLNRTAGTALVVVTHDLKFAQSCHRILELEAGQITRDYHSDSKSAQPHE
ncbi:MAG: ABC transporter ATP-binding protein [Bacteroidetes bacterium]|nr:ABC transporter ATP-binding protein [Bacteroidota bacterium]MCY4204575.1 ABC transporter ATP-binding protein [Bacteroidota bacterium]